MPQDRQLTILCNFSGFYRPTDGGYGGTMHYSQWGSNPPLNQNSVTTIVDPDGTIRIDDWPNPDPSIWSNTIDITFMLMGSCTLQDGTTTVPVTWSPNMNNDPNGQPAMLLLEETTMTPAPPNEVEASWVPGSNQTQILVDDKDESKNYYFRPAIVIPALNNYYISCDPRIVNKPGT